MPSRDKLKNREYVKRHYDNNPEYYRERNRIVRKRKTDWLRSLKENAVCLECGKKYPHYVLEFAHRNPEDKADSVTRMSSLGWKRIKEEVSKCDILCANCHLERDYRSSNGSNEDSM